MLVLFSLMFIITVIPPVVDGFLLNAMKPLKARIINGKGAEPGQFPWQAWIKTLKNNGDRLECGGALITSQHVLTAAHCVQEVKCMQLTLGVVDPNSNEGLSYSLPGCTVKSHPDYSEEDLRNDIAIIDLFDKIKDTAAIQPLKLPEPWEKLPCLTGREAIVSGFGITSDRTCQFHNSIMN